MTTTDVNFSAKRPLFSIIMPCYNSEDYIDRSIRSCINQTFDDWELIIINDGSKDNTMNIINSYILQDSRISVFTKENGGYVSAVNYGLEKVNGLYFMFLGSDDELRPSLFSDIYSHIQQPEKPDMIGFRTIIKKDNQTEIYDKNSYFDNIAHEYNSDIKSFSQKYPKESSIFFTRDTSKIYKYDSLGTLRYFGKKGMDADGIFSMMFAHKSTSFLCVPTIGYVWYLRNESLSGRKKDYSTQVDRIENWIRFGNELMLIDSSLITNQEKYYLSSYFYSIVKAIYFSSFLECIKNNVLEMSASFLKSIINHFGFEKATKEIDFFLNHTFGWKFLILPKIFFEKLNKKFKTFLK